MMFHGLCLDRFSGTTAENSRQELRLPLTDGNCAVEKFGQQIQQWRREPSVECPPSNTLGAVLDVRAKNIMLAPAIAESEILSGHPCSL
jgi:hypothetical protein